MTANILRERAYGPGGAETRHGTRHFRGGAKVHIIDAFWGTCTNVVVIGQRRGTMKWTRVAMPVAHLENFRAKLVYHPSVVDGAVMFAAGRTYAWTRERAEGAASAFAQWKREVEAPAQALPVAPVPEHIEIPSPTPAAPFTRISQALLRKLVDLGARDGDLVDAKLVGGVVVERLAFRESNLWIAAGGGDRAAPFDVADVIDVRLASWRPSWWWPTFG